MCLKIKKVDRVLEISRNKRKGVKLLIRKANTDSLVSSSCLFCELFGDNSLCMNNEFNLCYYLKKVNIVDENKDLYFTFIKVPKPYNREKEKICE